MENERFSRGDTVNLPFLIVADSTIVNISDGTVAADVIANGGLKDSLVVGSGVVIEQPAPEPSDDQISHGLLVLSASLTASLPYGARSQIIVYFVNSAGVRMTCEPIILEGV